MKTIRANDKFDEPVTEAVLEQAIQRGRKRITSGLHATAVHYLANRKSLLISFIDQSAITLPVENYPELACLSIRELKLLQIGFGGNALCLDEKNLHVSIAGLVSESEPLMEMAAMVISARNGSRSSALKSQTSRENGQRGGRPRKLNPAT